MNPLILLIWIPFLLLISGFPDQWTGKGGMLNDERIKLHEKETARLVAEMEEKEKKELRLPIGGSVWMMVYRVVDGIIYQLRNL